MRRYVFAVLAFLVFLVPSRDSVRAEGPLYTIENLGNVNGSIPTIAGLNAAGQVAGVVDGNVAVRYTPGVGWERLPGLGEVFSVATGINAAGDVVGYHLTTDWVLRAFRYKNGTGVEDIAPLPGGTMSLGYGINSSGEVVGYSDSANGTFHAFRASAGLAEVIPDLGGTFSIACGINDNGQIAGSSTRPDDVQHAMRINPDQPAAVDITSFDGDMGFSGACAIDATGRVGGQAVMGATPRAFLFTDAGLLNLDTFALSVSNTESTAAGVSVGWFSSDAGAVRAFVHTDADGSVDLNTRIEAGSGWVLALAKSVNAAGVIVGEGTFNNAPALFRLTPVSSAPKDTTPPVISALSVSPAPIVPANKAMVPVTVAVTATDNVDPAPVCTVSGIDGHGAPASDASVTGPLTGAVRATGGATYSIGVTCADSSGNASAGSVDVVVPRDTTPPVFTSLRATPASIWPPTRQLVTVTITASATDDSGETPVCTLASITGPGAPADRAVTGANTGTVRAIGGWNYVFNEVCVDGSNNVASSGVTVTVPPDTTAPVISTVIANPSTVWPPSGALVRVFVSVVASDDVDASPACALSSISSTGATADDFSITGPISALVRAVGGRTYTLTVRCSDYAGNSSTRATQVVVPRDTTAPVITSLSATPSLIWPPNNKLVPVTVLVSATDDVDASPGCVLSSILGAPSVDAVITGALTANVRAEKNSDGTVRTYALRVSCSDRAGNVSQGTAFVLISKDGPAQAAQKRQK